MKVSTLFLAASQLFPTVYSAACPFENLKRAGLLSEEDAAKFDAVKRDPKAAEILFEAHKQKREASPEAEPELVGPRKRSGVLDLPLGGGLLGGVLQKLTGPLAKLDIPTPQPQGLKKIPGNDPNHQFKAPGKTDVRGICPTLNALANHGYIDRSGITSFAEAANAVQTGYGFTYGLSVFLSALGLLAGGDLITGKYSIGGADARVPNTIGPALGLDKHGVFEIDGSITRQDVHFGNNANFIKQRWDEYVAISKKHGGLFNAATNAEDNGYRYDISKDTNPQFFAGVIWFAVSHAERVFVYEGLPNGTAPNVPDYANVAPFFLNETFPKDWYRRPEPLTLPSAFIEAIGLALSNPRLPGGNQGLDNFVPLQLDLSSKTPAQLGCFLVKNIFDLAPGQITGGIAGLASNLDLWKAFVKGTVLPFFTNDGFFNCELDDFVTPSKNAGIDKNGSKSSSGSPVNGAYPGIGVIAPDSQPS